MVHIMKYRVRYSDTDKLGVVYYANYLNWFEAARTELLREKGITYAELERDGIFAPVIEAHVNYKKPPQYDDMVSIQTKITHIGNTSLKFEYEVLNEQSELLVTGYTVHVFVDKNLKKVQVPERVRKIIE